MAEMEEQIKRIREKIQSLGRNLSQSAKEITQLKEEINQLRNKEREWVEVKVLLENQVAALKLVKGQVSTAEKQELEKKIQGYLKEIDRCINMLST